MASPKPKAMTRATTYVSIPPVETNPRAPDRWPSWKTHTSTPMVADSETTLVSSAWIGITTDPDPSAAHQRGLAVGHHGCAGVGLAGRPPVRCPRIRPDRRDRDLRRGPHRRLRLRARHGL